MTSRRHVLLFLASLPALNLTACDSGDDLATRDCAPVVLTDEDECALCGMTIVRHPGPKGQACLRDGRMLKFCSVHDLLAWSWQPESGPSTEALHVHDLSRTGWEAPSDEAWIDAREAVYVVGHDRRGAMGHSPAPFSDSGDAQAFARDHGGRLVRHDDLDWDLLRNGGGHGNGHDAGHSDGHDTGHGGEH